MSTISPKDIFQQGVDRLFSYMQPYGFHLTKNNEIKKKTKQFTTQIFFFRNSRNYISNDDAHGSVETEIHCLINIKGHEGVFRIKFGKSATDWFQLYDKEHGLNITVIDCVWEIIKKEYVDVIIGLETDAHAQFMKMQLMPEVSPEDFAYTCYLRKPLLEIYAFDDILEQYDKSNAWFHNPKVAAKRGQDRYFETLKNRINFNFCETVSTEYLLELLDEAYHFIKTTEKYTPKIEAYYQLCYERSADHKARFVIAVFHFLYPITYIPFQNEPAITALNQKILMLYKELIIRRK